MCAQFQFTIIFRFLTDLWDERLGTHYSVSYIFLLFRTHMRIRTGCEWKKGAAQPSIPLAPTSIDIHSLLFLCRSPSHSRPCLHISCYFMRCDFLSLSSFSFSLHDWYPAHVGKCTHSKPGSEERHEKEKVRLCEGKKMKKERRAAK